ncbi:MAG: hypothetical protein IJJ56_07995 [Prevotella sp.]|nr:hypothetical protein [Prevotella sp.]
MSKLSPKQHKNSSAPCGYGNRTFVPPPMNVWEGNPDGGLAICQITIPKKPLFFQEKCSFAPLIITIRPDKLKRKNRNLNAI